MKLELRPGGASIYDDLLRELVGEEHGDHVVELHAESRADQGGLSAGVAFAAGAGLPEDLYVMCPRCGARALVTYLIGRRGSARRAVADFRLFFSASCEETHKLLHVADVMES